MIFSLAILNGSNRLPWFGGLNSKQEKKTKYIHTKIYNYSHSPTTPLSPPFTFRNSDEFNPGDAATVGGRDREASVDVGGLRLDYAGVGGQRGRPGWSWSAVQVRPQSACALRALQYAVVRRRRG